MMSDVDPADHLGLVITIVLDFLRGPDRRRPQDSEEYADGCLGLLRAIREFDPTVSDAVPLDKFMAQHIRWAIMNGQAARRFGPPKIKDEEIGLARFSDLDARRPDDDRGFAALIAVVDPGPGECDQRDVVAVLLGRLDARERRLVERCVMQGWTHEQAAHAERDEPGAGPITAERVRQIVEGAVRWMRETIEAAEATAAVGKGIVPRAIEKKRSKQWKRARERAERIAERSAERKRVTGTGTK